MTQDTGRRGFMKKAGASIAAAGFGSFAGCVGGIGGGGGGGTIKLGAFEPRTGNLSIYGQPKQKAYQLAVNEINDNGGIDGRDVELVFEDNQSSTQRSQDIARRLIQQEEVDVLMGANTSATREAVRPVVDQNEHLYFYNNLYEGGVCDSYTYCTGLVPSQQLPALVSGMFDNYGDKVYSLSPDYNFGHISDAWLRKVVEEQGGEVLNTEFIPLDVSQFGSTISRLQDAEPDWVYSILVGEKQSAFYSQKASAGVTLPMASSFHLAESYEHLRFDPPSLENMHVPINFMEELKQESDSASQFVDKFRNEFPDTEYVNELAAHCWNGVNLYKAAVEEAGTTDKAEVRTALESGLSVDAPGEGRMEMYGPTHHMDHRVRLARCTAEHEIEWIDDLGVQREDWLETAKGCDLTQQGDTSQYSP